MAETGIKLALTGVIRWWRGGEAGNRRANPLLNSLHFGCPRGLDSCTQILGREYVDMEKGLSSSDSFDCFFAPSPPLI